LILFLLGQLGAQVLVRLPQFADLGDEGLDVLIDLLPVVALADKVEGSRWGWMGESMMLGPHVKGTHLGAPDLPIMGSTLLENCVSVADAVCAEEMPTCQHALTDAS
jgi:hypothetical protein